MSQEIKTQITVGRNEFDCRIEFVHTPYNSGSFDEEPAPEKFEITDFVILTEDKNGHEVANDVLFLCQDSFFEQDLIEQIKEELK